MAVSIVTLMISMIMMIAMGPRVWRVPRYGPLVRRPHWPADLRCSLRGKEYRNLWGRNDTNIADAPKRLSANILRQVSPEQRRLLAELAQSRALSRGAAREAVEADVQTAAA